MKVFDQIKLPVAKEIEEFEKYFRNTLRSNVGILNTIIRYLVSRKGKRIRPLLIFLSAGLVGSINSRSFVGAAMVELLHTATLIHDDVVDEATERRGLPSINAKWNNKIAVLLGDFLLAKGLMIAVENKEFEYLQILSNAVKLMSEGELLQIQTSKNLEVSEERYFEIIHSKTASLISACCEIGCLSASNNEEYRHKLREFGRLIGLAFQIRDDIFDYESSSSIIGKPVGNDIRDRKITLPLIYALNNAPYNLAQLVFTKVKSKSKRKDIRQIVQFVVEYDGIFKARNRAISLIENAKNLLFDFPDSPFRSSLLLLADYIVQREK